MKFPLTQEKMYAIIICETISYAVQVTHLILQTDRQLPKAIHRRCGAALQRKEYIDGYGNGKKKYVCIYMLKGMLRTTVSGNTLREVYLTFSR